MKTSEFLVDLYAVRGNYDRELHAAVWCELGHFFQQYIQPYDFVVDLGGGDGVFLDNIYYGRAVGVDARNGAHWRRMASWNPDVVFMSNFLEHLASVREIDFCLKTIFARLRGCGRVIVMGPNIRYTGPKYWDFADHKVPLTDRTVVELLRKNGFLIDEWHPRFLPYSFQSPLPKWPWLVRLYLKLPFLWNIFGEQMLIVAHKGES